jgi:flagellar basal-body rod protein FlgF
MAIQRQMDVIANNLANMTTSGFKAERVLFEEYLVKTEDGGTVTYVNDYGSTRDLQQGEMRPTYNPLDVGIQGKGYFVVQTADGDRYTRVGHLRVSPEGELVTQTGDIILDDRNRAIELDPNDPELIIATDGTITNGDGPVTRLGVVTFENEQAMVPVGDGMYKTDETPQAAEPEEVTLLQGMVESSNVIPILEMTRMIQASRAYQSTQTMLERDDDVRQQAIDRLGRIN